MKNKIFILTLLFTTVFISGCSYSFTGASMPTHLKTFFIATVDDRTGSAEPSLREKLRDKQTQKFISDNTITLASRNNADLIFDIYITGFTDTPSTITSGENVQSRKITITVNVTCKDMIKKAKYFEQSFSSYTDYKPSGAIMVARNQAIEESLDKIAEDIVLKTVSNW